MEDPPQALPPLLFVRGPDNHSSASVAHRATRSPEAAVSMPSTSNTVRVVNASLRCQSKPQSTGPAALRILQPTRGQHCVGDAARCLKEWPNQDWDISWGMHQLSRAPRIALGTVHCWPSPNYTGASHGGAKGAMKGTRRRGRTSTQSELRIHFIQLIEVEALLVLLGFMWSWGQS